MYRKAERDPVKAVRRIYPRDFHNGNQFHTMTNTYTIKRSVKWQFNEYFDVEDRYGKKYIFKWWSPGDRPLLDKEEKILKRMKGTAHFQTIRDRGTFDDSRFLIYDALYHRSINTLRRPDKTFSFPTAMGVSLQCLEALESLHRIGYSATGLSYRLFNVGLGEQSHMIYWTVFKFTFKLRGMNYLTASETFKMEQNRINSFRKNQIYEEPLPVARDEKERKTRKKEDIESWFFLAIHFLSPLGTLPWLDVEGEERKKLRQECISGPKKEEMFKNVERKEEMLEIMDYIFNKTPEETIEFQWIYEKLAESVKKAGADIGDRFDWEKIENWENNKSVEKKAE